MIFDLWNGNVELKEVWFELFFYFVLLFFVLLFFYFSIKALTNMFRFEFSDDPIYVRYILGLGLVIWVAVTIWFVWFA